MLAYLLDLVACSTRPTVVLVDCHFLLTTRHAGLHRSVPLPGISLPQVFLKLLSSHLSTLGSNITSEKEAFPCHTIQSTNLLPAPIALTDFRSLSPQATFSVCWPLIFLFPGKEPLCLLTALFLAPKTVPGT